ncbi:SusC/RagA family TonB-linked outer membrane protein [Daejeonella lutea]|nr:SusC/RagA family TonB-linked outer membrane protein [Daejeonella lutea]
MKQKLLMLLLLGLSVAQITFAQTKTVRGTVKGADDGLPIPGATVKISGTTRGVQTGGDGTYSIEVAGPAAQLEFSFIGYSTQQITVGSSTTINVSLRVDAKQLSEVVVTAFGIERQKRSVGYSTSTVGGDQLSQKSEIDPLRALSGKVAGVNVTAANGVPGSSTNFIIRGNNSFLGNTQALMVVDGIPFDNGYAQSGASALVNNNAVSNRAVDLDPNNIESITVLKGAAAAAQYGSRAANGVVLITTKTGRTGAGRKGFEVSYVGGYAIEQITGLPDYQNKYGAGTEFNYANANGSWGPAFDQPSIFPQGNGITNGTIPHWFAGNAALPQFPAGTTTPYKAFASNVEDFFVNGGVMENSVQISSGNDVSNFTASLARSKNDGIIRNSDFTRTNVNIGGNYKLANKINVSGSLSYVNSNQNGPILGAQNGIGQASAFARTLYLGRNWNTSDFSVMPYQNPVTLGQLFPVAGVDNPYWSVENNTYKSDVDRAYGNVGFDYSINSWLKLNYKIGVNTYTDRRIRTIRRGSVGANGIGEVTDDVLANQEIESTLLATVSRKLLPDLNFSATLGHNVNQRKFERQAVQGTGMVVFNIDDIDNTATVVPFGGGFTKRRIIGAFGDVQFDYKSYLFLNVTGRNDWSSTLPKANRSFFYPGASTAFVFTELINNEKIKNIISYGKLRAAYGKVGNDADPYSLDATYLVNPTFGNNASNIVFPFLGTSAGTVGNVLTDPNLTPEFTTEYELGGELRFLEDRIGIDFTYYNKLSENQIAAISIPSSTGFVSKLTNFGKLSNKGIEIGLDLNPIKNLGGFSWNIYGTFARNRNRVEELTAGLNEISVVPSFGDPAVVLRPGRPYGIMVGTKAAKDDDGNFLINQQTGLMLRVPLQEIGDPNPNYTSSLTNTFKFKGLSLSAQLDYRDGGDLYSGTVAQYLGRGVTTDTEDRLTPKIIKGFYGNATTFKPILDASGNKIPNNVQTTANDLYFNGTGGLTGVSELMIYDATVFRVREVALGYDIPKKWLGGTPLGSLNLSVTGRNLYFNAPNFPKGTNFDPETSTYGASATRNVQGIEYTNAPTTKRFGFNLRATF